MKVKHEANRESNAYVARARRRLGYVQEILLAWQANPQTHLGTAERALHQQAAESQHAGYLGIAAVCEDLAACLAASRRTSSGCADSADVLLGVCESLCQYVEIVAQSAISGRSRNGRREREPFDASEGA